MKDDSSRKRKQFDDRLKPNTTKPKKKKTKKIRSHFKVKL